MKITLVQSRGLVDDPKSNFFKARMRINNVDSDVFVFPEMYCCGYIGEESRMRIDSLKSTVLDGLCKLSDNRGCTVICGCPVKEDGRVYDAAMVIDGMETASYRKMCLSDAIFDEKAVFGTGNRAMIAEREGLKMGLAVGDDIISPDVVRFYAECGADMIVCISALTEPRANRFIRIIQSFAARYSMPILLCNMTGPDSGVELGGRSVYVDEKGDIVEGCTAGSDVREIRVDVEALNANTASRVLPDRLSFDGCDRIGITNTEADPNGPACPFSM